MALLRNNIEISGIEEEMIKIIQDTTKLKKEQPNLKTRNCKICTSISCNKNCLKMVQQELLNKRVMILESDSYICIICNRKIRSIHNIVSHVKGMTHKNKLKSQNVDQSSASNVVALTTKMTKLSISNSNHSKLNSFDNDSIITDRVRAQITDFLCKSPFDKQTPKECKSKKKSLRECLNQIYIKRYLEIEEEMYNVQQKLESIKINLELIMPYDRTYLYCLACNEKVSKELYLVYEHICLQRHRTQVNQVKKDINFYELSRQYIKKLSNSSLKCYACENPISNNRASINLHIQSSIHKKKYKKSAKVIDAIFDSISQDIKNLWYNIQRFCCVLCEENFEFKLEFITHINTKHSKILSDQIFDFCIPCTTLWLSQRDSYTKHCDDILHKYLLKSQDFMIGDFPDDMKQMLTQIDEISDILFQQTQVLLNDNISQEVKQSLENSVRLYFPTVKGFIFGSRVTGLGFPNSDIDIYLDCENTYGQDTLHDNQDNDTLAQTHFMWIIQILQEQKGEWEIKKIVEKAKVPIIKLIYKRNGLHCDVSTKNGLSVESSKLVRSFNDAYLPCRKLILVIKKWFSYINLPKKHGLTNYALAWLVIFYLQRKSYLKSVAELIQEKNKSQLICGWETGVAQPKNNNKSEQSISTLLMGFFQFYTNFDYQHYIICPLMGQPIAKQAFVGTNMLPEEMKHYTKRLRTSKNPEYLRIDSPLCVQDPVELSDNLTKAVTSITLRYFKQYCQESLCILHSSTK
ncbi:uncharacterized protein LOC100745734 isoform X1 [Bombus impatiens]|uniref:Uncharacterized protein LOC100745734 isoform X1 n=2 Tax=Bombus impatiens TaxID=132113 RepID=A0A6P8L497_BOMIM|nr:uncharacterized protein LOC100745734 isoform X1 [Bombus impatiens]XP_033176333.1 uncharacterized protein LOC100745734 isoform X1 [Bombus impatiens]